MSFWSDSSPVVKGVVVLGAVGLLVALMALFGMGPFGGSEPTIQERGLPAATQ